MKRLIRGGLVYDGTGCSPVKADVLIDGDRIAAIASDLSLENAEVIDATGLVVTPGFIDMHRHADIAPLQTPDFGEVELRQGITATFTGNCGIANVPVAAHSREEYRSFVTPIIGQAGENSLFESYAEYRIAMEKAELPIHMGFLAGTGAIKVAVKGFSPTPYTPQELLRAQAYVREAMEQGAFGVSLGFMYQPECYTTPEEQIAVIRPAAQAGGLLTTHIRGEGNSLVGSVREVLDIADRAGIRVHISHFKATGIRNWCSTIFTAMEEIERARSAGREVTADFYPYAGGSTTIFSLIPPCVLRDNNEQTIAYLATAEGKARLREAIDREDPRWDNMALSIGWGRIVIAGASLPEHEHYNGRSVDELFQEEGYAHASDFLCDLLVSEEGRVGIIVLSMDPEDVDAVARLPYTAVISDSLYGPSEHPHPRLYGTFPRFLHDFALTRGVLKPEEAFRKMTSFPAHLLGLRDRGTLRPGAWADVNLFELGSLCDHATYEQSTQLCTGLSRMLLSGRDVVVDDRITARSQGRVLLKND